MFVVALFSAFSACSAFNVVVAAGYSRKPAMVVVMQALCPL